MPRLPGKVQVDVTKCRACPQKCRGVTRDQGAPSAPPDPAQSHKCHTCTQIEGGYHQAPPLPRKTKVGITKCRACHEKCRGVTRDQGAPSAPPDPAQSHKCHTCRQNEGGYHQAPPLPRKTKVGVTNKCRACHEKCRGVTRDQGAHARHQTQPSPKSATPATQNECGCHQVPRLQELCMKDGV